MSSHMALSCFDTLGSIFITFESTLFYSIFGFYYSTLITEIVSSFYSTYNCLLLLPFLSFCVRFGLNLSFDLDPEPS